MLVGPALRIPLGTPDAVAPPLRVGTGRCIAEPDTFDAFQLASFRLLMRDSSASSRASVETSATSW